MGTDFARMLENHQQQEMKTIKWQWRVLAAGVCAAVFSSSGKKTADEIFEEQKSGVVLVLNKFYYKVEMPGGQQLFFNGIDQNGNLQGFTTNEEEAKANAQMLNGTGFFVSEEGEFVTNRHVALTDVDSKHRQSIADAICHDRKADTVEIQYAGGAEVTVHGLRFLRECHCRG